MSLRFSGTAVSSVRDIIRNYAVHNVDPSNPQLLSTLYHTNVFTLNANDAELLTAARLNPDKYAVAHSSISGVIHDGLEFIGGNSKFDLFIIPEVTGSSVKQKEKSLDYRVRSIKRAVSYLDFWYVTDDYGFYFYGLYKVMLISYLNALPQSGPRLTIRFYHLCEYLERYFCEDQNVSSEVVKLLIDMYIEHSRDGEVFYVDSGVMYMLDYDGTWMSYTLSDGAILWRSTTWEVATVFRVSFSELSVSVSSIHLSTITTASTGFVTIGFSDNHGTYILASRRRAVIKLMGAVDNYIRRADLTFTEDDFSVVQGTINDTSVAKYHYKHVLSGKTLLVDFSQGLKFLPLFETEGDVAKLVGIYDDVIYHDPGYVNRVKFLMILHSMWAGKTINQQRFDRDVVNIYNQVVSALGNE